MGNERDFARVEKSGSIELGEAPKTLVLIIGDLRVTDAPFRSEEGRSFYEMASSINAAFDSAVKERLEEAIKNLNEEWKTTLNGREGDFKFGMELAVREAEDRIWEKAKESLRAMAKQAGSIDESEILENAALCLRAHESK